LQPCRRRMQVCHWAHRGRLEPPLRKCLRCIPRSVKRTWANPIRPPAGRQSRGRQRLRHSRPWQRAPEPSPFLQSYTNLRPGPAAGGLPRQAEALDPAAAKEIAQLASHGNSRTGGLDIDTLDSQSAQFTQDSGHGGGNHGAFHGPHNAAQLEPGHDLSPHAPFHRMITQVSPAEPMAGKAKGPGPKFGAVLAKGNFYFLRRIRQIPSKPAPSRT
jgi:hypothetical protein